MNEELLQKQKYIILEYFKLMDKSLMYVYIYA